ncbi:MAG: iron ABC transporter permease [Spirochaetes bacterium]|nr:iron ABC transporter permease [Spirochaetota bacterium]
MNKILAIENKRYIYLFPLFVILFLLSGIGNLFVGAIDISVPDFFKIITGTISDQAPESYILLKIRIPRIIASLIGGGFLAVSGLLMQVCFRNPIVGPYILGISSGATLTVGIVMLSSFSLGFAGISPYMTVFASFAGALGVMIIIVTVASRMKSVISLLLIGIMMGYIAGAITNILIAFANKEKIKGFILWGNGSFSGFSWNEIQILLIIGFIILFIIYLLSKPLNAFLLGEDYAQSMGVNIRFFRLLVITLACAMASLVTAFAGPIGFVGMAVPHMSRILFKTQDNRILIPACIVLGGIIGSICDLIARTAFAPAELPLSSITAIFGAPIIISLLIRRRYKL